MVLLVIAVVLLLVGLVAFTALAGAIATGGPGPAHGSRDRVIGQA